MTKTPKTLGEMDTSAVDGISRRAWLGGAALALCAGSVFVAPMTAQAGVSQADAKYQDKPQGDAKCGNCMQFKPPSACSVVDGTVAESGWCQFYAKKA